jgi:hypothetical protein
MKTRNLLTLLLTLTPLTALADFKVHEWGTFTSLLGSNGVSQDGLYHEDEHLPDFVYGFGETRSLIEPIWRHCNEGDKGCIPHSFLTENQNTQTK